MAVCRVDPPRHAAALHQGPRGAARPRRGPATWTRRPVSAPRRFRPSQPARFRSVRLRCGFCGRLLDTAENGIRDHYVLGGRDNMIMPRVTRRKRAHGKGDHSLCSADRCPDLLAKLPAGRVAVVAAKLVEGLGLAEDEPRRLDAEVLLALAPRVDRGDTTATRELRRIAAALPVERPPDQLDIVDMLRKERRRRRAARGWPT